jgi:hypothetical protein
MIIFDIESGPNLARARELMPAFDEAEVKTGNLRDDDKKAAKIAERRATHEATWLEGSALRPETAVTIAIGIQPEKGETIIFHGASEDDSLQSWWDFFTSTYQRTGETFCGWGIFHFDLPFLIIRSRIHGIPVPSLVRTGRYFNATMFRDLQEDWLMNRPRQEVKHSLDYVARALECGKKSGEGKEFASLYRTNQEAALNYLRNDLMLCQRIARKLRLM